MSSGGSAEKTLGQRIKQARTAAGLTQQDLCHKTGLSYSTLAKIERGAIRTPSVFTIQQIAIVLRTTLDELTGTPPPLAQAPKQQSKSGVRFVYFDVNGVMVRFFQRAFTALAEDSGVPADQLERTFWHYNDAVCRGEVTLKKFNTILAEQCELPGLDWTGYYLAAIDPIPESRELVTWAAEHYHVGLLSNIMPGFLKQMIKAGQLPDVPYSAVVESSAAKAIKPEAGIYKTAQKKAGVDPGEILLVDDSQANLVAAEHQGWHVMWFDDYRPAESAERVRQALEF